MADGADVGLRPRNSFALRERLTFVFLVPFTARFLSRLAVTFRLRAVADVVDVGWFARVFIAALVRARDRWLLAAFRWRAVVDFADADRVARLDAELVRGCVYDRCRFCAVEL